MICVSFLAGPAAASGVPPAAERLPRGWDRAYSALTHTTYYIHLRTGMSQRTPPATASQRTAADGAAAADHDSVPDFDFGDADPAQTKGYRSLPLPRVSAPADGSYAQPPVIWAPSVLERDEQRAAACRSPLPPVVYIMASVKKQHLGFWCIFALA